jgi:hypothetical protein
MRGTDVGESGSQAAATDRARLLSNEYFSVDGTLIESWAAVKSMRRRSSATGPTC